MYTWHLLRELTLVAISLGYHTFTYCNAVARISTFAGEVLESGTPAGNNVCEEQEIIATGLTNKSGTTQSYGKLDQESDNL